MKKKIKKFKKVVEYKDRDETEYFIYFILLSFIINSIFILTLSSQYGFIVLIKYIIIVFLGYKAIDKIISKKRIIYYKEDN